MSSISAHLPSLNVHKIHQVYQYEIQSHRSILYTCTPEKQILNTDWIITNPLFPGPILCLDQTSGTNLVSRSFIHVGDLKFVTLRKGLLSNIQLKHIGLVWFDKSQHQANFKDRLHRILLSLSVQPFLGFSKFPVRLQLLGH